MAQTAHQTCQVLLLPAQSTLCAKKIKDDGLPYCQKHRRKYAVHTKQYKDLSAEAERLNPGELTLKDIRALGKVDVLKAIKATEIYRTSLDAEITARKLHHLRYFGRVDDGHGKWLALLAKRQQGASTQLDRLSIRHAQLMVTGRGYLRPATAAYTGPVATARPVLRVPRQEADTGVKMFLLLCIAVCALLWWLLRPEPLDLGDPLDVFKDVMTWLVSTIIQCIWLLVTGVLRMVWALVKVVWFVITGGNTVATASHALSEMLAAALRESYEFDRPAVGFW